MSWLFAESLGFDCVDAFYLEGKTRLISGKVKHQEHSRSYVSVFYVFKKSHRKKIDYLTSFSEEVKDRILKGIKENNIKEGRKFLSDGKAVQNICHADTKEYEYVDLGLPSGLKWAKCNVGAETETDYGDYFQWGEIEPHDADTPYVWANYKYADGWNFSKYNTLTLCGETPDGKTTLDLKDDAATHIMGSDWRMPTQNEFQELLDNTDNEWIENFNESGVNGRKFTSRVDTSKYIFIPASGSRLGSLSAYQSSLGFVWSSSLYTSNPNCAWNLYFDSDDIATDDHDYRNYGHVVRGVMD